MEALIIIRPTSDFSVNGAARGTLVAYDAQDEPLWESRGNWSDNKWLRQQAEDLADELDITIERARALLRGAVRTARQHGDAQQPAPAPAEERTIVVSGRQLPEVARDAWDALLAGNEDLYSHAGVIVELAREPDGRRTLRRLSLDATTNRLAASARWVRRDQHGTEIDVWPSERIARHILADADPPVRQLLGIAGSPVISAAGDVVTRPGYDPVTQIYLDTENLPVPIIPSAPTRAEIDAARTFLLEDWLGDMPWESDSARANAMAVPVTVLAREQIQGPVPAELIEAPTEGTGKDLLAEVLGTGATGHQPLTIAEAHGDEEWRKRLTGAMLQAPSLINISNIKRRLDSPALAMLLTSWPTYSDRALGGSQIVTVPARAMIMATGNNPSVDAEIGRRIVRVRLDAGVEVPSDRRGPHPGRQWRHPQLRLWTLANRAQLLGALLTLVRAWVAEGRPGPGSDIPVIGSFEAWREVVGGILGVAGIPGLLGDREAVMREARREIAEWEPLVREWWASYRDMRVGVEHLHPLAVHKGLLVEYRASRSEPRARKDMGVWLARMRGRVIAGYRIEDAGEITSTHSRGYRLSPAQGTATPPSTPDAHVDTTGTSGVVGGAAVPPGPDEQLTACPRCGRDEWVHRDDGRLICQNCGAGGEQ